MREYSWLSNLLDTEKEPITDKQKAIIKAAVELFSEKGYAATSTREIAQRAGVAEGTIFKQYPTKKDLMLRITERIIHTALFPLISSGINELIAKPYKSREEFLAAFLQNRMGLIQEGVPLFKIILQEIPFQPEIRAMLIKQIKKMPFPNIVEKLRAKESPGIPADSTAASNSKAAGFSEAEVIQILLTCISGFFILRNVMMPELFPKSRLSEDAATLVRFITQGLKNEEQRNDL